MTEAAPTALSPEEYFFGYRFSQTVVVDDGTPSPATSGE